MENRNYYNSPAERPLLPLGDEKIEKILKDIRVQEDNYTLFHILKRNNPNLYNYFFDMRRIRPKIGQFNDQNAVELRNYFRGAAFMERAIRASRQENDLNAPKIPKGILETLFFDQMGGEDAHVEIETLKSKRPLGRSDRPLSPLELLDHIISETIEEDEKKALAVTLENLVNNSEYYAYNMFLKERQTFRTIEGKISLPRSRRHMGGATLYEASPEFVLGAAEIYRPFEIFEEIQNIERIFNTQIR